MLGAGHGGLGPVAAVAAMMEAVSTTHAATELRVRFAVLEPTQATLIPRAAERYGVPFSDA